MWTPEPLRRARGRLRLRADGWLRGRAITVRAMTVIGLLVLLLPGGAAVWATRQANLVMVDQAAAAQSTTAESAAAELATGVATAEKLVAAAAAKPATRRAMAAGDSAALRRELAAAKASSPLLRSVALLPLAGPGTGWAPLRVPGPPVAPGSTLAAPTPAVLPAHPVGDDAVVVVRVPVDDPGGRPVASLVAEISLARSAPVVRTLHLGRSGRALVVDDRGMVLVAGGPERPGQTWALGAPGRQGPFTARRFAFDSQVTGRREVATVAQVADQPWQLVVLQSEAEFIAPVRRLNRMVALGLGIAAGLLALLATAAGRNLALHERRLRAQAQVIEAAADAIIACDLDGRVRSWNRGAELLYGWPAAEAVGRPIDELLVAAGEQAPAPPPGQAAAWRGELTHRRADGTPVTVLRRQSVAADERGRPSAVLVIDTDVSATKQAEEVGAHLASVVAGSDDAILTTTLDGKVAHWNAAAERIYGWTAAQITGRPLAELVPPEGIGELAALMAGLRAGRGVRQTEAEHRRADGAAMPVSVTVSPVRDGKGPDGGRLVGASLIVRDERERRRLEAELRRQRDLYERLLGGLSELGEGVAVIEDERLVFVNDSFCQLTGYQADELLALGSVRELAEAVDGVNPFRVDAGPGLVDLDRTGDRVEARLRRRGGDLFPVELAMARLPGGPGLRVQWIAVVRDISVRVAFEVALAERARALQAANAELREVSQLKTDLVAMLSHDVGQPLSTIIGWSEVLADDWDALDDERRRATVAKVHAGAARVGALVRDVLTMARLEAGAITAERQPVGLAAAVGQAAEAAAAFDAVPAVAVSVAAGLAALADPGHLQQILVNLLTNAAKYGRPPFSVTAVPAGPGRLRVEVADEGEGVPEQFVPQLFERFSRAASGTALTARGTGLGLWIVRRLAEANGGRASYEPNRPGGARFVIELERAAANVHATSV